MVLRCCETESSLLLSAVCGREHALELAGEVCLVSMSHILEIELNLVLDSSSPLQSTPPCIISGAELQTLS